MCKNIKKSNAVFVRRKS